MSLFDTDLESLQSLANDGLTLPSMSAGNDAAATASTPITSSAPSSIIPSLPSVSGIGNAISSAASNLNPVNWIFSSRFVAIVLGLICIAGAIFLFKGPSVVSAAQGAAVA